MKQLIASIGNQTINQIVASLLAAVYLFIRNTLRVVAYGVAAAFIGIAFVCLWAGAKQLIHQLPTSIEIIKTFF